jgi:Spy/CpxP family protein refolding chaperone
LSGTLDIEAETERLKKENEKLDAMILQARNDARQIENETEQVRNENARLAELESKIDGLFSKYNIKLPQGKTPDQS